MKRIFIFLLYFIPIPLFIITINYFADPANIFSKDYEKGIVEYLVKGNNVTNVVNYKERLLQKYFIEKIEKCPDVMVLGSSRIMQIRSEVINSGRLINNGVSISTLEDCLATYYMYEKRGCSVKKVIIGLEPYMLNEGHGQSEWRYLEDEFNDFFNNLKISTIRKKASRKTFLFYLSKYNVLLSSSYFKASFNYLIQGKYNHYIPTTNRINDGFTRLSDGSIYYDRIYRTASPDEVEYRANSYITDEPAFPFLKNFTTLSERYKELFSAFILYLQKQNIEVEFILSPFHPIFYNHFTQDKYYHIVFECENYYRAFASANNIRVFGSYDPHKLGFDNSHFLDGFHCKDEAIIKILE